MMGGYYLPPAADVYWKTFRIPAASVPTGAAGTAGFRFLQHNERRVGLIIHSQAAATFWVSDQEFGFPDALPFETGDGIVQLLWPPRNQMFVWQTGGAADFRYVEEVYQDFRASVGQDTTKHVKSGYQR